MCCGAAGIDVLRRAGAAVTVASVESDLTVTCASSADTAQQQQHRLVLAHYRIAALCETSVSTYLTVVG
jgi:putative intracellular protease/amidase